MLGLDAATLAAYFIAAGALILVPGQDTLIVLTSGLASRAEGSAPPAGSPSASSSTPPPRRWGWRRSIARCRRPRRP
ncbi:hypothetical protein ACFQFH_13160 [Halobaculum halobium]|uniref:hypothetical protein n=1 Tax=Halobaculum halobium TaxID=3032281 RepID=UPI003611FABC